ncbi:3'-5' exonuclease [Roseibium aggregatum]|uniref:DNA-directed DNA polymerase n=1 Tax=Roseibium aggregatum TaxID=187304 RepID=A0A939EHY6_9HYPH|nr:3'-5' exonuclease [Roseibium aggregatum]MBN9673475.1 3'-5' exonuclease [Roseibium aggregatum]
MFTSLSLRLRIFLFFLGVAAACAGIVCSALYLGYLRGGEEDATSGLVFSGVLSVFGILAVTTGVWFLFDENVAKPIERLAAAMRVRAHADAQTSLDLHQARYLGDLAPAVDAVTGKLSQISADVEEHLAEETARLMAEKAHLAILLTEIPVAIVLVSPAHLIMLYDGQAADLLGQVHVPRLSASIFDYFNEEDLRAASAKLTGKRSEVLAKVRCSRGNLTFELRLKKLSQASGYMILVDQTHARIDPRADRPLIYDFDFREHESEQAIENRPLQDLTFVVFDTETTGLTPHKDEIVQIGAVRVIKGRIVAGEEMDQLVNPGRSIPIASTKVHGITDDMVADAPDAEQAVGRFHDFSRDAVLVAHNAPFDMAFMQRYGKALGFKWDHPLLDTVLLSAVLFGENETHTLDAVCERLGVHVPEEARHTALGDAKVTAEALCKMLPILASRGYGTFGEVIEQTRKHGRLLKDLN